VDANHNPVILQVVAAMDQGGVEQGTLDMALYIAQKGWGSIVASQGGRLVSGLKQANVQHITLPLKRKNPLAILCNAYKLVKIIRSNQVSLLHTRSRAPAWATLVASRITGVPFITSFHGTHRIQNKLKWLYNSVMTKGMYTIANSNYIWQHVREQYHIPEARLRLAQRGTDIGLFNPEATSNYQIEELRHQWGLDNRPVIFMPGRLTRWKGQTVFIEALAKISDLDWQALITGGADNKHKYEEKLKNLARQHGIDERIIFTGSQNDLPPYYALAYITVSASTEPEAFGRVAIESQAMGTPVIATAHGGSLETIKDGNTGWLVPPNDAETLAKVLRKALENSKQVEIMGRHASQWVHENFTTRSMCEKEFSVYQEVLGIK